MLARDLLEHPDELLADHLALVLGIGDARELLQEPVRRLHVDERHLEMPAERLLDLVGLVLAVQAVIDEDARQLISDRPMHEQRRDRRVDAARERAEHLGVADLIADRVDGALDDVRRRPVGQQPARRRRGTASGRSRPFGVCATSGWNCTAYSPRSGSSIDGDRDRVGVRRDTEARPARARRRRRDSSRPARVGRRSRSSTPGSSTVSVVPPVLALSGRRDLAAERLGHQLVPVADAEDRHAQVEDPRIDARAHPPRTRTPGRRRG